MKAHHITMLGTGLIGDFYTNTLHGQRGRDRVRVVFSQSEARAKAFRERWAIPESTTDLRGGHRASRTPTSSSSACPNYLHEEAVALAAAAGKAVLCTKPLGRTADEARRMLETVEEAGVFGGYLEDLCYTPKTLKAIASVEAGAIGDVTWVRSRETHPGPHSAWFWDGRLTGGGAIIDLGCHCIEIIRNFVGKGNRPVEVMCTTDTLVHPIDDEDNAIALIRFESGAIGQFEVSWTFRGGMDLRDEVAGTHGTIWLNHFLRTGFEMFTRRRRRRLRRREGRDGVRLAVPGRRRGRPSWATSTCSATCSRAHRGGPRAARDVLRRLRRQRRHGRRLPVGEEPRLGAGRALRVARRLDAADREDPETFEGQIVIKREVLPDGRDEADPQGPGVGRLHRPDRRRRLISPARSSPREQPPDPSRSPTARRPRSSVRSRRARTAGRRPSTRRR